MRKSRLTTVALGLCALVSAQSMAQVPRHDTVQCELNGGHRIELRSRYLWVPVNPHPNSDRTHFDQEPYKVRLLPQGGKALDLETWLDGQPLDDAVAASLCAEYGATGRLVFSRKDLILLPQRQPVPLNELKKIGMVTNQKLRTPEHQALLQEHGLAFPIGWAFRLGDQGELWAEQGLLSAGQEDRIAGVLRFETRDLGKTWTALGYFESSAIFQLGRSWEQQPFIGHPIRANGKSLRQASRQR